MTELVDCIPESAVVPILVLDFDTLACEETSASGFNRQGCRVRSSTFREIEKHIGLRLAGFDKMIKGRVVEVLESEVVVSFEFFDDDKVVEKRHERRRQVSISAWVKDRKGVSGGPCTIVDASKSGCRLSGNRLDALPNDIVLEIAGLDLPVNGKIVWRSPGVAGVRLLWQFSSTSDINGRTYRGPNLAAKVGAQDKAKKRRTNADFGVQPRKQSA